MRLQQPLAVCNGFPRSAGRAPLRLALVFALLLFLGTASPHEGDVPAEGGAAEAHADSPWGRDSWDVQEANIRDAVPPAVVSGVEAFDTGAEAGTQGPHSHEEGAEHAHSESSNSTLRGGNVPHILIVYFSQTKHTERLADIILNGALDLIPPCHIEVLPVHKANHSVIMEWADVLVLGTPVINREPAKEISDYVAGISDEWRPMLSNIRGAVFATSGGIAGGQEVVLAALNGALDAKGIKPLAFPDCRYMSGLTAVTGFPPFCRQSPATEEGSAEGCEVSSEAEEGEIHSKFEAYGYEYGRQLVRVMADPNASGPYR